MSHERRANVRYCSQPPPTMQRAKAATSTLEASPTIWASETAHIYYYPRSVASLLCSAISCGRLLLGSYILLFLQGALESIEAIQARSGLVGLVEEPLREKLGWLWSECEGLMGGCMESYLADYYYDSLLLCRWREREREIDR
jgi:hypothetical protein